uniref:Uncharacterized protein n=1 Tax=Zea mays TaxID=4577 RepID=B6T658_MAIZE|nr:hypothetical protein [Zea mays]ACG35893.1 hypothetical protein [Zea mays]
MKLHKIACRLCHWQWTVVPSATQRTTVCLDFSSVYHGISAMPFYVTVLCARKHPKICV